MNCVINYVYRRWGAARVRRVDRYYRNHPAFNDDRPAHIRHTDEIRPCYGPVKAVIEARDEPYYGGTSAVLEIRYVCTQCGEAIPKEFLDPTLPSTDSELSEWVTQRLP